MDQFDPVTVTGTAQFQIADTSALTAQTWADWTLVFDSDLKKQESKMPQMAQALKATDGTTPYDGKRELAKLDVETWLRRRNINPDLLLTPWQLKRALVFLELSYIFGDMATRNDEVNAYKSDQYQKRYNGELETVELDYADNTPPDPPAIPQWRPQISLSRG